MPTDTRAIVDDIQSGMVPAYIYADPEIFELERERVFGRTWNFLAHESEIPNPGDYVVRNVLEDSFIVVRDEHGVVRVHFNMCLHRGMQVCRAERGNASHFRCSYHAWTYSNSGDVVGVAYHESAYGGDRGLPKKGRKLITPPHVDTYRGMIFVCLDPDAGSLDDFLGDYKFFFDMYLRQSDEGALFRGPQRWRVPTNWKVITENGAGDSYHTAFTHASIMDVKLFGPAKRKSRKLATTYVAGAGSGTTHRFSDEGDFVQRMTSIGFPLEMAERMRRVYTPAQVAVVEDYGVSLSASGVMPNIAIINTFVAIEEGGGDVPFTSLRTANPISATECEVLSWFVVDKAAPPEFQEASYRAYSLCFGPGGMFEQDDIVNFTGITRSARGSMARSLNLNSRLGLTLDDTPLAPAENWPAPGEANLGFGEFGQRSFLRQWAELLDTPSDAGRERRSTIGEPDPGELVTGRSA
jgi:phenylpropionate dioxygenase-like ring-hydroxylating dioxygenase large terminal subunit